MLHILFWHLWLTQHIMFAFKSMFVYNDLTTPCKGSMVMVQLSLFTINITFTILVLLRSYFIQSKRSADLIVFSVLLGLLLSCTVHYYRILLLRILAIPCFSSVSCECVFLEKLNNKIFIFIELGRRDQKLVYDNPTSILLITVTCF